MRSWFFISISVLFYFNSEAQKISGTLTALAEQSIKLEGFNGFKTYTIATSMADKNGYFTMSYGNPDFGMAYLVSGDNRPMFVVLSGEDIELKGADLSTPESIQITKGYQNQQFARYATEQPKREQALSAWTFLENIYQQDSMFALHKAPFLAIAEEKKRLHKEGDAFLQSLPSESYLRWFLPVRKLVSTVSAIAQYRPEEIPSTIAALRDINYGDERMQKSGLLKDALESHFWLIENSGKPLDSVFAEMRTSIDVMIPKLVVRERQFNEITDYLFDLLERHSLFDASEYLALKVLNEVSCTIDNDLAKQLETYRAMKKGNVAPDFDFAGKYLHPGYTPANKPARLSGLKSNYTLVVFGASWCPKCTEEVPEIAKIYQKWKAQGVEVVFVSLDEDEKAFMDFSSKLPFISVCDLKKWKGSVVGSYYVFATPTMYLLDGKREILLRPNSVNQIDSWVDWFLVQGNKR